MSFFCFQQEQTLDRLIEQLNNLDLSKSQSLKETEPVEFERLIVSDEEEEEDEDDDSTE